MSKVNKFMDIAEDILVSVAGFVSGFFAAILTVYAVDATLAFAVTAIGLAPFTGVAATVAGTVLSLVYFYICVCISFRVSNRVSDKISQFFNKRRYTTAF